MFSFDYSAQMELVLFLIFWFGWCWLAAPCKKEAEQIVETVEEAVQELVVDPARQLSTVSDHLDFLIQDANSGRYVPEDEVAYDNYKALLAQMAELESKQPAETYDDYEAVLGEMMQLSIRQLKAMAKARTNTEAPIKGYSKMKKAELAAALLA